MIGRCGRWSLVGLVGRCGGVSVFDSLRGQFSGPAVRNAGEAGSGLTRVEAVACAENGGAVHLILAFYCSPCM